MADKKANENNLRASFQGLETWVGENEKHIKVQYNGWNRGHGEGVWSAIKGDQGIKRDVLGRKKRMMEQSDYCWGSGA